MDKPRILSLLDQLDGYVADLVKYVPQSFKLYSQNIEKRRFTERTLQLCIEVSIDIASIMVKDLRLGLPSEEENVFDKLKDAKVISSSLCERFKSLKRFRNVLIHKYPTLDDSIVYRVALKERDDFNKFKKEILLFFKKNKKRVEI